MVTSGYSFYSEGKCYLLAFIFQSQAEELSVKLRVPVESSIKGTVLSSSQATQRQRSRSVLQQVNFRSCLHGLNCPSSNNISVWPFQSTSSSRLGWANVVTCSSPCPHCASPTRCLITVGTATVHTVAFPCGCSCLADWSVSL